MDHIPPYVLVLIQRLILREGGISDRGADRGGYTNAGITLPTLSRFLGHQATPKELSELDQDTAINIYFTLFWLGCKVYLVHKLDPQFGEFMLDWEVNSGAAAAKHLQSFLGCEADGNIGPETLGLLKDAISKDKSLFNKFVDYRAHFVANICIHDSTQLANLNGWLNRIFNLRYIDAVAAPPLG